MHLTFSFGKLLLCSALLLQGLYIAQVIPNTSFPSVIQKSFDSTAQSLRISKHPVATTINQNIGYITYAIGGLIALAGLNIFGNSRFIIKLNILGLFLLTLFIGVPLRWIESKASFFDPSEKAVLHLITNWGLIGGLIYWHSTIRPKRSQQSDI